MLCGVPRGAELLAVRWLAPRKLAVLAWLLEEFSLTNYAIDLVRAGAGIEHRRADYPGEELGILRPPGPGVHLPDAVKRHFASEAR